MLDAGTGTGRMLELLAPHVKRAIGVDVSPEMLAIARDRLLRENLSHAQVRLGDTYRLPFAGGDAASMPCCSTRCCIISTIPARGGRSGAGDAAGRAAGDRRFRAA